MLYNMKVLRAGAAIAALGFVSVTAGLMADDTEKGTPAQILFNRVRAKVLDNVSRVPRYTCVETVTRVLYHPQYGNRPSRCSDLVAAREQLKSPGLLMWHDRLRLDVAVGKDSEMFSWAGGSSFETGAMGDLAGTGATGSGAFGSFLMSVFGKDGEKFRFVGDRDIPQGKFTAFEFEVPQVKSHYQYTTGSSQSRIIGYHGAFYVVPATAGLRRLEVIADSFPPGEACRVVDTMDYSTVKIGSGEFMLPEVSTMDVLYSSGDEAKNETHFSGCREYVGETKITFDDPSDAASPASQARAALKALPPKTRIRVKVDPPISTETAAAGDPITAAVEHEVRVKGQVLVRTSDRLHGRILRLEQDMVPTPRWTVAIRFDSIERDGVTEAVNFKPVDDGDRVPTPPGRRAPPPEPLKRPAGAGVFILAGAGNLTLDQKFHSEWETK
jgi:hypothetical protein